MSNGKDNKVLLSSGLLLAFTSSLCCIVPVLAIIGGAGGTVAAFSWAAPLRPYLLVATVLVLGFAFYRAYKPQAKGECGCAEKKSVLQSKTFLWAVAVISILLSAFPYYANVFQQKITPQLVADNSNMQQAVIHIKGMGCEDCEGHVNNALLQRTGVRSVRTSYAKGETMVKFDSTLTSLGQLAAVIEKETGYKVIR
ncbi:MAG TPA: mercuric transport protein MerTP [Puia sp.]|nr:mercuric transport protein MerTP [Puia sp.]